jgi:hypothetical protein
MSSGIICRKCGGNHLTIKCNKDKPLEVSQNNNENKQNDGEKKQYNNGEKKQYNNGEKKQYNNGEKKQYDNGEKKQYNNGEKKQYINGEKKQYNNDKKNYVNYENKNSGKVKMSSLPNDISKEELQELLYDWGHIKYINIKKYYDETVAYIEFRDEDQANYLIEALDNTPFDYRILKLCRIE